MSSIVLTVRNKHGLHATNAKRLAALARRFDDAITVRNLSREFAPSNCKTLQGVLAQDVRRGQHIELNAHGDTGLLALDALQDLIETNFEVETFRRRVTEIVEVNPFLHRLTTQPEQLHLPF